MRDNGRRSTLECPQERTIGTENYALWQRRCVESRLYDRLIGALETCSRTGRIVASRSIPRDGPILKRRKSLGPSAFVFGSPAGEYAESFKTAWESLLLVANGHETKRAKHGASVDREKFRQIDLHRHGQSFVSRTLTKWCARRDSNSGPPA